MVNYSILNLPSILDIYWPCLILIILSCFFFTLILKSNIAHVIWIIKEGTDNLTTNVIFFFICCIIPFLPYGYLGSNIKLCY